MKDRNKIVTHGWGPTFNITKWMGQGRHTWLSRVHSFRLLFPKSTQQGSLSRSKWSNPYDTPNK
jgi:hypothetical protein